MPSGDSPGRRHLPLCPAPPPGIVRLETLPDCAREGEASLRHSLPFYPSGVSSRFVSVFTVEKRKGEQRQ